VESYTPESQNYLGSYTNPPCSIFQRVITPWCHKGVLSTRDFYCFCDCQAHATAFKATLIQKNVSLVSNKLITTLGHLFWDQEELLSVRKNLIQKISRYCPFKMLRSSNVNSILAL